MDHRRDIDGLRAVAVLAVLIYHFNIGLPGGFTGVDVFFVISGFVIANSIISDTIERRFSIANFYFKRVRRIFPAYVFTTFIASVFAYWYLLPQDFLDYAWSLAASSAFASNIYFWKTSGYFAASAHTKPLLHTWSLSVEEQFYIFAPILVNFIYRFGRQQRALLLLPLLLSSLALSVAAVFVSPTAGFFLLFTRAWELLTGVFIASMNWRAPASPMLRELMATLGAALMLAGIFTLTEQDPFPGWSALLPCLGTAFVIQAGNRVTVKANMPWFNRLLSMKPFVWVGLISYSLYLVHWPIVAYARYELLRDPNLMEGGAMMVASIGLAVLSWRFIERPFRRITLAQSSKVLTAGIGVVLAGVALGWFGATFKGVAERFPDFAERRITGTEDWGGNRCFNQDATRPIDWDAKGCTRVHGANGRILVWGDSFAAHYMPGVLRDASRINADVMQYTFAGCPPILEYYSFARVGCSISNARVLSLIRDENIDTVIMIGRWTDVPRRTLKSLPNTISELKKLGARVYVFGQSPQFAMDVQRIDYISGARMKPGIYSWHVFFSKDLNATLRQLAVGATFIDPMSHLCSNLSCPYRKDDDYYYADYGHFSTSGSMRAVSAYFPAGAQKLGQRGAQTDSRLGLWTP
jgi:peptidoglycan/LPS O-acetylase OafA/YrhL